MRSSNLDRLQALIEKMSTDDSNENGWHDAFDEIARCSPLPIALWSVDCEGNLQSATGDELLCLCAEEAKKAYNKAYDGIATDFVIQKDDRTVRVKIVPHMVDGEIAGATGMALDVSRCVMERSPQLERSSA